MNAFMSGLRCSDLPLMLTMLLFVVCDCYDHACTSPALDSLSRVRSRDSRYVTYGFEMCLLTPDRQALLDSCVHVHSLNGAG
jgi:hypothetical protein